MHTTISIMKTLFFFIYMCFATNEYGCTVPCPDYYWRDFTGAIPEDAFVGGNTGDRKVYVGQVFIKNWNLQPATIEPGTGLAYVTLRNQLHKTRTNVKILASPNNDIFEWIPIHSRDLRLYKTQAVPAEELIYIGRTIYDGDYRIGKVFDHSRPNRGLTVIKEGKPPMTTVWYELLIFNCSRVVEHEVSDKKVCDSEVDPALSILDD